MINKRSRKDTLIDLVRLSVSLYTLKQELSKYSWDTNEVLVTIKKIDIYNIINRYIDGEITNTVLEEWANLIECRDDIGFYDNALSEIIFYLANLEINGGLNENYVKKLIDELS